jgi:hypothetical protein
MVLSPIAHRNMLNTRCQQDRVWRFAHNSESESDVQHGVKADSFHRKRCRGKENKKESDLFSRQTSTQACLPLHRRNAKLVMREWKRSSES